VNFSSHHVALLITMLDVDPRATLPGMKFPFDKLIARLIALGIPALVLVAAIAWTGLAGGAAIVAALALLGGPLGMMGGVLVLGLLVLISHAIADYGFETVFLRVLRGLRAKGYTKAQILKTIEGYPISLELKLKLAAYIEKFWDDGPESAASAAPVRPPKTPRDATDAKPFPPATPTI
jgi:hypothetical protein